jgi:copper chaperone CopZ
MKTTIFKIEGMNCDACANAIKSLVEKEPGVRMASVSFNDRQARVLYDPKFVEEERLVDLEPRFRQNLSRRGNSKNPSRQVIGREPECTVGALAHVANALAQLL